MKATIVIVLMWTYLSVIAAASLTKELLSNWETFKSNHTKKYKHGFEEKYRFKVFRSNLKIIDKHNKQYEEGKVTFKMGVNKFADLTFDEFKSGITCFHSMNASRHHKGSLFLSPSFLKLPSQVDWRKEGYVTDVKDQGQCGSCWAFSATGALEGQNFKKSGHLESLSEQNLVDCSKAEGNEGCSGGLMDNAFEYIQINNGIDTESSYPYEGMDDTCRFNPDSVGATVTGHIDIPSGSEPKLVEAIASVGPVSVAIHVMPSFQLYHSGIYDDVTCTSEGLNHGVLAVGYGKENGKDYYIVKNSWGIGWGHNGYILMRRNRNNQCGIASAASYPLV